MLPIHTNSVIKMLLICYKFFNITETHVEISPWVDWYRWRICVLFHHNQSTWWISFKSYWINIIDPGENFGFSVIRNMTSSWNHDDVIVISMLTYFKSQSLWPVTRKHKQNIVICMWNWNWFLDTWLNQRSRWTTSFEGICARTKPGKLFQIWTLNTGGTIDRLSGSKFGIRWKSRSILIHYRIWIGKFWSTFKTKMAKNHSDSLSTVHRNVTSGSKYKHLPF